MVMRGPKPKRSMPIQWSAQIAYATGLFVTDGCMYRNGRHLELTSKDEEQLRTFMKCIKKEIRITYKHSGHGRTYGRLQFSDVKLYAFFRSAGIMPAKTKIIGAIRVPDDYYFDFLRGHFDGDGSFYSYADPRWPTSFMFYLVFVSASKVHIDWLQSTVMRLAGVHGHMTKSDSVFQLRFAKTETVKLLKKMYYSRGVLCLTRKRKKIERALAQNLTMNARVL